MEYESLRTVLSGNADFFLDLFVSGVSTAALDLAQVLSQGAQNMNMRDPVLVDLTIRTWIHEVGEIQIHSLGK